MSALASAGRGASLLGGAALVGLGVRRRTVGGAVAALAGAGLLYRSATASRARGGAVQIQRSLTIELPREDVYRRWRDPQVQPVVWAHLAEVTNATGEGAHWRVDGPLGRILEWDTRIVEEREGELVRWHSTSGNLANEGTVEFRDALGDFGTEVALRVRFDPPAGPLGDVAVRLLDAPPKLVLAKALRRFKSLVESGEIPSTDRNPSARAS